MADSTAIRTVLVCGGRDYADFGRVFDVLTALHRETPIACLIEGGAHGADDWGACWADMNAVRLLKFKAQWDVHGRAAGPIRNQRMIDEGKPDLVVAFPGGRGTADMVRRARTAGIEVIEVAAIPREAPRAQGE